MERVLAEIVSIDRSRIVMNPGESIDDVRLVKMPLYDRDGNHIGEALSPVTLINVQET